MVLFISFKNSVRPYERWDVVGHADSRNLPSASLFHEIYLMFSCFFECLDYQMSVTQLTKLEIIILFTLYLIYGLHFFYLLAWEPWENAIVECLDCQITVTQLTNFEINIIFLYSSLLSRGVIDDLFSRYGHKTIT